MEYTLSAFAERLAELVSNSNQIPVMGDFYTDRNGHTQSDEKKHSKRPTPRDLKSQIGLSIKNSFQQTNDIATFDIGNDKMEQYFPYYHILQQAPVIRKRGKATTKTKGSEAMYKNPKDRDYERVMWNGKTFTKEYSRNVRGSRINLNKTQMHLDGQFLNTTASQYLNMNYEYLDKVSDEVANKIAQEFGMKLGRKKDSGLIDEFANQEGVSIEAVLEAFESFMN